MQGVKYDTVQQSAMTSGGSWRLDLDYMARFMSQRSRICQRSVTWILYPAIDTSLLRAILPQVLDALQVYATAFTKYSSSNTVVRNFLAVVKRKIASLSDMHNSFLSSCQSVETRHRELLSNYTKRTNLVECSTQTQLI